ncbi:MAG TPA: glycosyltransferase family 2 protein [bacterium]|nr:glycosyltransferase family 2 protein [bacterium]
MTKYDTSLRPWLVRRLEQIDRADIVAGIPCYNNQETIGHVVRMVSSGLHEHFPDKRSVIIISDGGSTDDSRELAREAASLPWQERIVTIYRGLPGKGSALRTIFEAADRLDAAACMVVDSDLRSISNDWVPRLLTPVIGHGYDFVAPIYTRYKYDGTITNNVVYSLTRALYGWRIRQPIGGDFAFSGPLARYYMRQDVWDTDVARFGIDIWMTTSALVTGFRVCQARLGVKVHDAKDPAAALGPMFRQVIYTLFALMEQNEMFWKTVRGSEPTEIFGQAGGQEPEPIEVNHAALCRAFREGLDKFGVLWQQVFRAHTFESIRRWAQREDADFRIEIAEWVEVLYELAVVFHQWPANRYKLLEIATPLYNARVASFINETRDLTSEAAEQVVEAQAEAFESGKDRLLELWGSAARPQPILT